MQTTALTTGRSATILLLVAVAAFLCLIIPLRSGTLVARAEPQSSESWSHPLNDNPKYWLDPKFWLPEYSEVWGAGPFPWSAAAKLDDGASAAANAATGAADAAANAAGSAAGAGGAAAGAVAAAAGKAAGASEKRWMHREMIPIDRLPSPSHLWAQPRDWF
ncbi:hypothetical protein EMIHUDRAFT_471811 [Emiliania huxleyi CCMP1516]|uniref:Alpha-1,3-glucosyltransferase n=2 Tax=Emiliania huxleyi TaxID=2903 RepID=A0A0D3HXV5_EMIH1|nr:hypothetical protein EMIHUDRAFT_471811 [Emiliania huxleyi CCMP1516]EOD03840.1 hypothetical protein EMIHUDRAFT_471811 [Emiliania huxleyi CCMP1516]|eukprot:XP_005756269.1 hypothetical protein EMIHUDRAFT_471811 [Emiliania huxleyi CCMP1516]